MHLKLLSTLGEINWLWEGVERRSKCYLLYSNGSLLLQRRWAKFMFLKVYFSEQLGMEQPVRDFVTLFSEDLS